MHIGEERKCETFLPRYDTIYLYNVCFGPLWLRTQTHTNTHTHTQGKNNSLANPFGAQLTRVNCSFLHCTITYFHIKLWKVTIMVQVFNGARF